MNKKSIQNILVLVHAHIKFLPRACTRSTVIGSVHLCSVSTKIARSEDSGILVVSKHDHVVGSDEKLSFFCFLTVDAHHQRYT